MENTLPCTGCRGLCCGPVAITEAELKKIKKKVKTMPRKLRSELENQKRYYGTCIFYDLDQDKCGIYSARPEVCQKFGFHKSLVCFKKPELAVKEDPSLNRRVPAGVLSVDYTWKDFK